LTISEEFDNCLKSPEAAIASSGIGKRVVSAWSSYPGRIVQTNLLNVKIKPNKHLTGHVLAPPSKAQTHRALFCALLTRGLTKIINPLQCDDTKSTANAMTSLGAKIFDSAFEQSVLGLGKPQPSAGVLNCGESAVTMRFVIPILSLTGAECKVTGQKSLMRRPIEPLANALEQLGVQVTSENGMFTVHGGPPEGGEIMIRGDVSSQFISGLLLAGTLMKKGLIVNVTSSLESRNYVLLTIEALRRHGVEVHLVEDMTRLEVSEGQKFSPAVHKIGGDFSSASYILAAAAITGSPVAVHNLAQNLEPDSAFIDILARMGVRIDMERDKVNVEGGKLKAVSVNLKDCPDLGPTVAVLGCYAEGETEITGAARLRYKESNRLAAMRTELHSLGADVTETEDGLILKGPASLSGGSVYAHNDHRIAMALSVAALGARSNSIIRGAECVSKSYPNFFADLRSIGAEVEIIG
jgi:3-phosphoshikimate 1-carboxyvinyltransferase